MQFTLSGFSQVGDERHFAFERVAADRTHVRFVVEADLRLLRTFKIAMQELPLMCQRLLEKLPADAGSQRLVLTDENMREHAAVAAAALEKSALRKRPPVAGRKPGQASTFGQFAHGRQAQAATMKG